jgi:hypothetical protein
LRNGLLKSLDSLLLFMNCVLLFMIRLLLLHKELL